jgi:hypothetical protein
VISIMSAADVIGPAFTGHRARRDRVDRAAGHQLLGRLENQPQPDRQLRRPGQRERGAQQDRGVPVVPAGMRGVGHRRGVHGPGPLGHRQRIHVGPQRDSRLAVRAEVAGQPRPAG